MKWQLLLLAALCSKSAFSQFSFSDQSSSLLHTAVKSGTPIGVSDMNGDGLDDIIRLDLTQRIRIDYQNAGGFTGYTHSLQFTVPQWGICIADVDENGYNDILSGGVGQLNLLKATNSGNSYTQSLVTPAPLFLQTANFADIDNDGLIDIFACDDNDIGKAYRNLGTGNFVPDTSLIYPKSTVPSDNSGNYGSVWIDYNNDGHLDLYISKCRGGVGNPLDGRRLNLLFKNDGFGNFTEVAQQVGLRPFAQSWATDFADIDNDGDLDCFIIDHEGASKLYRNGNFGTFTDITAQSGLTGSLFTISTSLQVKFEDFDNDGYVDLLFTGGSQHSLFHNNGDNTFEDAGGIPTGGAWMHTAATGDLDNDGHMDIIAGFGDSFNSPGTVSDKLFINNNTSNNHFKVRLQGTSSNRNGIGARLELYGPWGKQIREVRSGESYGIHTSMTKHFGLGQATFIDSLVVRWPSGVVDRVVSPDINTTLLVQEGSSCVLNLDFDTQLDENEVTFADESSIGANQWLWSFGDGAISMLPNPVHEYAEPGFYLVCLQASGLCGSGQICKTVDVNCQPLLANFSRDIDGLTIAFEDNSLGNPDEWTWTFGDGETSTEQNPQHTFPQPGVYEVCLVAGNNCGSSQLCETFTVACNSIEAGFTNDSGELTVEFNSAANFNITAYNWSFGDDSTSTGQNPVHVFALPGTYEVCLVADGPCGQVTVCRNVVVTCPAPQATFSSTSQGFGLTHAFSAQLSGDVDTYSWTFGDGGTSTEANPLHTYLGPSFYQVCLTVEGVCGSSEICQTVLVTCAAPEAAFTFVNDELSVGFTDNSANGPTQWAWTFGDGGTSSQQNPQHVFMFPGTYQVCLTASGVCGSSETCHTVTVSCSSPQAAFLYDASQLSVAFENASSNGVTQLFWNFGDGNSSTDENPNHLYSQPGTYVVCLDAINFCGVSQVCDTLTLACAAPAVAFAMQPTGLQVTFSDQTGNQPTQWAWTFGDGGTSSQQNPQHTYNQPGTYQICLTATSVCGNAQHCEQVTITCPAPAADFSFQQDDLEYNFSDQSSNQPTQWLWTFGDGGTSNQQNPSHTYTLPGTYQVCLTATSLCGTSQQCEQLTVTCAAPQAAFSFQPDGLHYSFLNQTVNGPGLQWSWAFGDGGTSTQQFPTHTFPAPGTYQVCLTAVSICGSTQSCQFVTVTCTPPVSAFQFTASELQVAFTDQSTNQPAQWSWTFGDGGISTQQFPSHAYALPGTYQVCLTTTSICGSSQTCQSIIVSCAAPEAGFSYQSTELEWQFDDLSTNDPVIWQWTFGDGGTSSVQNPQHTYAAPGTYQVCLTAISLCGTDQACTTVTASCIAPQADFEATTTGLLVSFSDISLNEPTSWNWTFGDGGTSAEQNPQHTYAVPNSYVVCLTVSSACGNTERCELITITCDAPSPGFSSTIDGLSVLFSDASDGSPTSWAWTFGDGSTSTQQNPPHTYDAPGTYQVCLTATNECGSLQHCNTIELSCAAPAAAFSVSDLTVFTRLFVDASTNNPTEWFWTFGDGNTSTEQNPVHTYSEAANFEVCLIASNACGKDTICQLIVDTDTPVKEPFTVAIYPNPVSEKLQLHCLGFSMGALAVSLTDASGRLLRRQEYSNLSGELQETMDVTDLPSGVYWLSCRSAEAVVVKRVVKQ